MDCRPDFWRSQPTPILPFHRFTAAADQHKENMQKLHPLAGRSRRALATGMASLLFASAALFTTSSQASAQEASALVDALVRKGVLTNKEAEDIRTDLLRDAAQTSAGKIQTQRLRHRVEALRRLSASLSIRRPAGAGANSGHEFQQSRYRFRLRVNAEAKTGREWFAGFSLGTRPGSDSEDQTSKTGSTITISTLSEPTSAGSRMTG